ncbi:MAG: ATP-dependent helicase [Nitrosomonas sp.]|nr:ATP-dependent helicase [Nitrosomonas sp.]OQW80904.1 MAG: DNA helicase UvrD [Proteobacteria bacterium ST_bin16]TXI39047.1 MAG: ATP-dependent helicase [Nitrosomonas sp.]
MIKPEEWRPSEGLTLEPNALKAATEQDRCLALTAGPGAGKTEMLAQRADFLLRTGACRYPNRILAISFKVDASRNLKNRVRNRCGSDFSGRLDSYTFHAFAKRIIDRFRPVLTGDDALDPDYKIGLRKVTRRQIEFSDLVPLAIEILNSSQVARNAIRKTYSDVFLDEFQDCTDKQYQLVKLAFQGTSIRLTAVGDTKQKIMAWAGALEGIFSTFAVDFNALPLNMYRNFRSKPRLLRMQNEIIRVLDPASMMPDEQITGDEGEIFAWVFETSHKEAEYLANLIASWIQNEGIPHAEIAILVSKQPDLYVDLLMMELEKRGIPYRNEQQLQDLSVEPTARLIVDYLLSLYGSREPGAWLRLMDQLIPFADEVEQADIRQDWQRFIKAERKQAEIMDLIDDRWPSAWSFVETFLNKVGSSGLTALSPDYESTSRLGEVIQETKARIEELLNIEPNLINALVRFSDDQAVRILTIHKSKGLEFDSVIILGAENETFWGKEAEERCAFFVGVSRAKQRLVLTVCQTRITPPSNPNRWREQRNPHQEFIGYARPFLVREA